MTGKFGFPDGLKYFRPKVCKCGATFYGPDKECDTCFFEKNYIHTKKCVIENAEGRCGESDLTCEHYKECLAAAEKKGWTGWRKVKDGNKT